MKKYTYTLTLLLSATISGQAIAYPVEVMSSIPVTTEIVPQLSTANGTLEAMQGTQRQMATTQRQIGTAIRGNGDKISAMIEQSQKAQQTQDRFARQTERLERARRTFKVPDSICSESASGVAAQVSSQSRSMQSSLSGGDGGITDITIREALTQPTPAPEETEYQSAALHKQYCDEADYAAYGGTSLCPAKSVEAPGADKKLSSVIDGAGEPGKAPDLTFSKKQTNAAMAYVLNTSPPAAGRQLTKGEVKSASGKQYAGLMTQYQALLDAAREPQLAMIAASQPSAATKDALAEAMQSQSAKNYFAQTASKEARRTHKMSQREFENFEAGRRYASTDYLADLQHMEGDNLLRESIRVQSLQNWLLLSLKREQEKSNILSGQQLALQATLYYRPQLNARLEQVKAGLAR